MFSTRAFNQDPLENFFGQVRQHGVRNTNPNCNNFLGYYKSLLINTYIQTYTKENCEVDDTSGFLVNLKRLLHLTSSEENKSRFVLESHIDVPTSLEEMIDNLNVESNIPLSLIRKMTLTYVKNCETCHANVNALQQNNIYLLKIVNITYFYLPIISHLEQFSQYIKNNLIEYIDVNFLECDHVALLKKTVICKCVDFVINNYFQYISKILKGIVHPNNGDILMQAAEDYYKKHGKTVHNKS